MGDIKLYRDKVKEEFKNKNTIDLRKLSSKSVSKYKDRSLAVKELKALGVQIERFKNNNITIVGMSEAGLKLENTMNLKTALSKYRKFARNADRIELQRRKYDIEAYEQRDIRELVRRRSERLTGVTGIDNYLATQRKILASDEKGKNKLYKSSKNEERLLNFKFNAFEDPFAMLKSAKVDLDAYGRFDKFGNFIYNKVGSKKELEKVFAETFMETFEDYPEAFYGWLYRTQGTEENGEIISGVKYFERLSPEEQQNLYTTYAGGRMEMLKGQINEEEISAQEAEITPKEIDKILSKLSKKGVHK